LTKIGPLCGILSLKQLAQRREKEFEGCKRKKLYKGKPIKIIDFSTETLKAIRAWSEVF
jgi:hypothetical protein